MFDYRSMTIFECLNLLVATDRPVLCDADEQCAYIGELEEDDITIGGGEFLHQVTRLLNYEDIYQTIILQTRMVFISYYPR